MPKKGILDQKFTTNEAIQAAKNPNQSELMDRPFSVNQALDAGKEVVSSMKGGSCAMCGCGLRAPVRTVIHDYVEGEGARKDLPKGMPSTRKHMKALRESQGATSHFVKGSDAAQEHMAALRELKNHKAPKAPRKGRFAKGSEEARAFMAKLREMRKKI